MDLRLKAFPFTVKAQTKTNQGGNEYNSIGLCHNKKNQDGSYENIWINLFRKEELLIIANLCNDAYSAICRAEQKEYEAKQGNTQQAKPAKVTEDAPFDDDIPF